MAVEDIDETQNSSAPEEGTLQAIDTEDGWMSDMDQVHITYPLLKFSSLSTISHACRKAVAKVLRSRNNRGHMSSVRYCAVPIIGYS